MKQSKSSQPTEAVALKGPIALNPAVRGGLIQTYDEARPGRVEADNNAGRGLMRLANALSEFDSSLRQVGTQWLDRKIEEAYARGEELYANNPDSLKNQKNWADFTEVNPQYSWMNPYLQRGYEQARLKALAIDHGKALDDAFIQSGMINEKDTNKVNAWLQEQSQSLRKDAQLDKYENPLTLAQNYTKYEFQNRAGILAKHSAYMKENLEKEAMQMQLDLMGKEIDQALSGKLLGDPRTDGGSLASITDVINNGLLRANMNGITRSKNMEMVWETLKGVYFKHGQSEQVLKLAEAYQTADGVSLINQPGVRQQIEQMRRQKIERARSDLLFAQAQERERERKEEKYYKNVYPTTLDINEQVDYNKLKEKGVPPEHWHTVLNNFNALQKANFEARTMTPEAMKQLGELELAVKLGVMETNDLYPWVDVFGTEIKPLISMSINRAEKKNEKAEKAWEQSYREIFNSYSGGLINQDDIYASLQFSGMRTAKGGSKQEQQAIQALRIAVQIKDQIVKKYESDNNGKSPDSSWIMSSGKYTLMEETGAKMQALMGKQNKEKGLNEDGMTVPAADRTGTGETAKAAPKATTVQNTAMQAQQATPVANTAFGHIRDIVAKENPDLATEIYKQNSLGELGKFLSKQRPAYLPNYENHTKLIRGK